MKLSISILLFLHKKTNVCIAIEASLQSEHQAILWLLHYLCLVSLCQLFRDLLAQMSTKVFAVIQQEFFTFVLLILFICSKKKRIQKILVIGLGKGLVDFLNESSLVYVQLAFLIPFLGSSTFWTWTLVLLFHHELWNKYFGKGFPKRLLLLRWALRNGCRI